MDAPTVVLTVSAPIVALIAVGFAIVYTIIGACGDDNGEDEG